MWDTGELGSDCSDCGKRVRYARVPYLAGDSPPPPLPPPPRAIEHLGSNVFERAKDNFYVYPSYRHRLGALINNSTQETVRHNLMGAWSASVAFWVDAKAKINGPGTPEEPTVESILKDAARQHDPPMIVFVLHNLPNRGCLSASPYGSEICCHYRTTGACASDVVTGCDVGLEEYKGDVVDTFASLLDQVVTNTTCMAIA